MRQWFKYSVESAHLVPEELSGYRWHFTKMGGYFPSDAYKSKRAFFDLYLRADERVRENDRILRQLVPPGAKILSLASGRGVNELSLQEELGCLVTCSDLAEPPCLEATRSLFPGFDFRRIDVLNDLPPGRYDVVMALCLFFAFNDTELRKFFEFARKALRPDGRLIVELAGVSDNFVTRIFHEVFLPAECWMIALYKTLRHRVRYTVRSEYHGYRRSRKDVEKIASEAGFMTVHMDTACYDFDFRRSVILSQFLPNVFWPVLRWIGRCVPHVRVMTMKLRDV